MRRIHDAYLSAELDKAPLETLVLLHLLILLPSDPLFEKVKSGLVERMRLEPIISSLDEVVAYIQSQESDFVARTGTGGPKKASKVNQVKQQEEGDAPKEPKKEFTCKIFSKVQVPLHL